MLEATAKRNLLTLFEAYAAATGLSPVVISQRVYGNRAFLDQFKAGARSITTAKFDEMLQTFSTAWPPGTRWPKLATPPMRRPPKGKTKVPVDRRASR